MISEQTQYQRESKQARLLNLLAQLKVRLYEDFTPSQNINIIDRHITGLEKQIKNL